jgi:hypothetical protein
VPNVEQYARKYGIPLKLARALIHQESGGRKGVRNPKSGATGLTQVLPSTYVSMYGGTEAAAIRKLKNPNIALDAGFRYLSEQKKAFKTWRLALAAYNAGPGAVHQYGGIPPYKETQNYVRVILGRAGVLTGGATPALEPPQTGDPQTPMGLNLDEVAQEGLEALRSGTYSPQAGLEAIRQARAEAPPIQSSEPNFVQEPQQPQVTGGDWQDWVKVPPARGQWQGPGPEILGFVGTLAQTYGKPLDVSDTTTHSRMTTSGHVSAHTSGHALDIPATGNRLRRLGYLALLQAGMSKKDALKARRTGGLFNVGGYQVIFATNVGGNHYNHVHVGIRG